MKKINLRNHNAKCIVCNEGFYRRPKYILTNLYCSKKCFRSVVKKSEKKCLHCNNIFVGTRPEQKYCSHSCSGLCSRKSWKTALNCRVKNDSDKRLKELINKFSFTHCMVVVMIAVMKFID